MVGGLQVHEEAIAHHVRRELPFMATEELLMKATLRGGDRQRLHEVLRQHSMTAHRAVARGKPNPLVDLLSEDPAFDLERPELEAALEPRRFTGRASEQVVEFLDEVVASALAPLEAAPVEEPRI